MPLLKKTFDMYYACKSYIYYNQKALHSNEWKKNHRKKRKVNCYSKDPNNLYIQERKERILVTKSNFNQKKKVLPLHDHNRDYGTKPNSFLN